MVPALPCPLGTQFGDRFTTQSPSVGGLKVGAVEGEGNPSSLDHQGGPQAQLHSNP